jgi:hypothetical protein
VKVIETYPKRIKYESRPNYSSIRQLEYRVCIAHESHVNPYRIRIRYGVFWKNRGNVGPQSKANLLFPKIVPNFQSRSVLSLTNHNNSNFVLVVPA